MGNKITASFIIEIAGKPKETVDKALNLVLDKMKKTENNFKVLKHDIGEGVLDEKSTLFSGFLDVEIKFSEISDLMGFVFDYTPTSIEIVEPQDIEITNFDFSAMLSEMSKNALNSLNTIRRLNATVYHLDNEVQKLGGKSIIQKPQTPATPENSKGTEKNDKKKKK